MKIEDRLGKVGICIVCIIAMPSVRQGLRIEFKSWGVVYKIVRPSVGLGSRIEDRSWGDVHCPLNV